MSTTLRAAGRVTFENDSYNFPHPFRITGNFSFRFELAGASCSTAPVALQLWTEASGALTGQRLFFDGTVEDGLTGRSASSRNRDGPRRRYQR